MGPMARRRLKVIGYWYAWHEPDFPFPQDLVGNYEPGVKERVLAYLNYERHSAYAFRGSSFCRFDDCDGTYGDGDLGNHDLSDGTWLWPEGLGHYVEVHGVMLPPAFIEDAQQEPKPSGVSFGRKRAVVGWKSWAATFETGELRQRADKAKATFEQWEAQQISGGAEAKADAPTRHLTRVTRGRCPCRVGEDGWADASSPVDSQGVRPS